jgi:hypothetical protein
MSGTIKGMNIGILGNVTLGDIYPGMEILRKLSSLIKGKVLA